MSRLIPHVRQPQYPAGIDRNNPLGARTLALYNGINNYLHGVNEPLQIVGTPTFDVTPEGRAVTVNATGSYLKSTPLTADKKPTELTIFWAGVILGAGTITSSPPLAAIFYNDTVTTPFVSAQIARSFLAPGSIRFSWSDGSTLRSLDIAGQIVYGQYVVYKLSIKSGEVKAYKNGAEIGSSALASSVTYSTTSQFVVGGHITAANNPYCSTTAAGYLKGGSTQAEVISLTANVWQLFQPARSFNFRSIISGGNRRRRLLMVA